MDKELNKLIDYDLSQDVEQLIDGLEEIIKDTEDYYGLIYKNLPRIERNIDLTKQETEILTEYFIDVNQIGVELEAGESEKLISESLSQIKSNLKDINQLLLDQEEMNKILDLFLNETAQQEDLSFSYLLNLIKETTTILEEVEIISLNAIIFSAKLGNEAKAFSVISNNIHDISQDIEDEFYKVSNSLDNLADWHQNFSLNIKKIIEKQDQINEDYIAQIDDIFIEINESVKGVNLVLNGLLDNVVEVVAPFEELMALIQGQDIIRQNLENISKSLYLISDKHDEFIAKVEDDNELKKQGVLDYITFMDRGTTLLERLAENVFAELFYALDEIVAKIDILMTSLADVKEDAESLTTYFYADNETGNKQLIESYQELESSHQEGLVDDIFADIFDFSNDFLQVLSDIKDAVTGLKKDDFKHKFTSLERELGQIEIQLGRLNKVEVLARIELARLDKGESFGRQIEDVVNNVIDAVGDNTDIFFALRDKLKEDLDQFDKIMKKNQQQIATGLKEIEQSLDELSVTNDIINQAILALYKEIENLSEEINQIYANLKKTDKLKKKGNELLNLAREINRKATAEKDKFLLEFEIEEWELEDGDLKDIVSNLTTFLEIKTVDEFLNSEQEVDDDGVEGELTLF